MKKSQTSIIDLMIVSERPAFAVDLKRLLTEADPVRLGVLEIGAKRGGAAACLAALEARDMAVLLIDAASDAAAALLLARQIFDRLPSPRVIVAGPGSDAALILGAQRAGASEFLPSPFDRVSLMDALQRLRRRVAPESGAAGQGRGRIFTFLGSKGGCGTTTVATNLAVTLARRGQTTLLVDFDLTAGDVALLLDLTPSFGVADVLENVHRLDRDLLNGMILTHKSGLRVLCASEDPDRATDVDPSRLPAVLAFLREQFECVIVNTRDAFDPIALTAATHADAAHVVACLDLLSLRRTQWALRRLTQAGIPAELLRLVINRYDKDPYISLGEAEQVLGMKVAWTIPADLRTVRGALNEGIPAVSASRNGLHASFETYGSGLVGPAKTAAPARRRLLGLFSSPGAKPSAGSSLRS